MNIVDKSQMGNIHAQKAGHTMKRRGLVIACVLLGLLLLSKCQEMRGDSLNLHGSRLD